MEKILFKIKGFFKRHEETEEEKRTKVILRMLNLTERAKNAESMLHLQELVLNETALELDAKRKQDYIQ